MITIRVWVRSLIGKNKFSPSFEKFKETLIYANPFSIITARGHSPKVIKKGVKLFINIVLTPEEKREMIYNIKDVLDFGSDKTVNNDTFQIIFPTPDANSAIVRIS